VGFLDWLIMLGGAAGFVGTLLNVKMFYDVERLDGYIRRFGERRVRIVMATAYLMFALIGAALIVLNRSAQ